jgi:hypothetical protein
MKHKPLKMDRKLAIDSDKPIPWCYVILFVFIALCHMLLASELLKWTVERERVRVEQMEAVR